MLPQSRRPARPSATGPWLPVPARWAHSPGGIAPLTVVPVSPGPCSGRRAPARPRARARRLPAPRSRPSSRCPGGRRPLALLLLPPAGRESAARRPGTRRGAGAAPNRPRIAPLASPASREVSLCAPCQPLREPRRREGFPHSPSWRGQAPSVGWGSPYEGRWQPELIQPPWSGARTTAEEGGSI